MSGKWIARQASPRLGRRRLALNIASDCPDTNNRQMHMSNFLRVKDGCKGSGSAECKTIEKMTGVRSSMPSDDPAISESKVVTNYDADDNVVSYTLIDRNSNQPTMIMEPLEFAAYQNASPGLQAMMELSSQYALDFASAGLHSANGNSGQAYENLGAGLTSQDYFRDVALGIAGAAISAIGVAKPSPVLSEGAANAGTGLGLKKQLANQQQLFELTTGKGLSIAGNGASTTLRDAPRLASEYGGNSSDWSKISSQGYVSSNGIKFEIHAYRNAVTGQIVEPKSIRLK